MSHNEKWQKELQATFKSLEEREQLEAAGKSLSTAQALEVIDVSNQLEDHNHWKLTHLLVGIPHHIFMEVLSKASPSQFEVLKGLALREPLQHHLTLFIHEISLDSEQFTRVLDSLRQEIEFLDLQTITHQQIEEIKTKLQKASCHCEEVFKRINKALLLAWNSNRPDLVDKLNTLKEYYHRYTILGVGMPHFRDDGPIGLYAELEHRLESVYHPPKGGVEDVEALNDDDSAVEALARLSVWYLEDYWEVGLLPQIKKVEHLRTPPKKKGEKAQQEHQEQLFVQIRQNLEKLGLNTVADVKRAQIYSKQMLKNYIAQSHDKATK